MLLIPSMELRNGQCVYPKYHKQSFNEVVYEWPLTVAERWIAAGARRLHLIDVDSLATGGAENSYVVEQLVKQFPDITIQVYAGACKNAEAIDIWLAAGVRYLVINIKNHLQRESIAELCTEFPGRIIVLLDALQGRIVMGTRTVSYFQPKEIIEQFVEDGVESVIYHEISPETRLAEGVLHHAGNVAQDVRLPTYTVNGINHLDDVAKLHSQPANALAGVILGRPLYSGAIDLESAITRLAEGESSKVL